jgi:hypothetical protein
MNRLLKIGSLQVHLDNVPIDLQQQLAAAQLAVKANKPNAKHELAKVEQAIVASQASLLAFKATPAIRGTSNVADALSKRAR